MAYRNPPHHQQPNLEVDLGYTLAPFVLDPLPQPPLPYPFQRVWPNPHSKGKSSRKPLWPSSGGATPKFKVKKGVTCLNN